MKAKRLISFLLALTMAVSLLGGICLTASADEQEIPVVEVSDIPLEPEIGETIKNGVGTVPEGAGYTVAYEWCLGEPYYEGEYGYGYSYTGFPEGVIEAGKDYWFIMVITVDDSWAGWEHYVPGEDLEVQVNINGGEKIVDTVLHMGLEEFDGKDVIVYEADYLFSEEVNEVEITGVKPAVTGEIASIDGISVPENAPYSIVNIEWIYFGEDTMRQTVTGEEFLPGQTYYLEVRVAADNGYHFTEDCAVYVNGEESYYYFGVAEHCVAAMPSYRTHDSTYDIASVEFSYFVSPEIGKNADEAVEVIVPENVNYEVTAYWLEFDEENRDYVEFDVFEAGKNYELIINVDSIGEYVFTEDTSVIINGELLDRSEYDCYWNFIYPFLGVTFGTYTGEAEPVNVIYSVEISDVQAPVAGELLDDSVTVLTEGCTAELNWSVVENGALQPASGTAEKGKEYCLDITVTANEGYSFAEEIDLYVDGQWEYTDYHWNNEDTVLSSLWYDTCEVIESVAITSTDKAELGAAATANGVSVPEGANYTVSAYWGVLDMENGVQPFTGEFADNTVYVYTINVAPAEGYKFDDEATVTYNGVTPQDGFCYGDSTGLEIIGQVFTGTMQRISRVELNAKFKAGMKAADAVVTVPENAGYQVADYYWVDMATGEEADAFLEGRHYGLVAFVVPEDGYVIEYGAKTLINGSDEYEYMSNYAYLYGYAEVIMECEAVDTDGNPGTGDDSGILLLWAVMLLSVIGLISVLTTGKRRYQ